MKQEFAAFVLTGVGMASAFGTPHILVETECQTFRNKCTQVIVSCTYAGMQGRQVAYPQWRPERPGSCPYIALMPMRWPLWQWHAVWPAAGAR